MDLKAGFENFVSMLKFVCKPVLDGSEVKFVIKYFDDESNFYRK